MNQVHSKLLVVAGLALFAVAGAAEAIIIHGFPIFSVVNGAQTVRINAVLQLPPEADVPCPVTVTLIDSQGNAMGNPNIFQLRGGVAVFTEFIGDPNIRIGARLPMRVLVTYTDPEIFPGCGPGVLTSVEVFNKLTRETQTILANPVATKIPVRE